MLFLQYDSRVKFSEITFGLWLLQSVDTVAGAVTVVVAIAIAVIAIVASAKTLQAAARREHMYSFLNKAWL